MAVVATRRSLMTLFSDPISAQSHRVRLVMSEKGIGNVDIIDVKLGENNDDLVSLNPYNVLPTLVDRELVLYDPEIISEYLDERFPHPPLMPVDPVSRAKVRLALLRIEEDYYALLPDIEEGTAAQARKAKKELREALIADSEVFGALPYFLSDEFSLADCAVMPILWRLNDWGIELPPEAAAIRKYADRMFRREGFKRSLTELERELAN
ncbi:MAG: glutathione S-transferase N-terminal domain-containing protein [Salinisphaeraceae bacterium]|nr:glutathione S-transferase N-terminal domain-containing protein [Salinisphaeraceae bacterium]